MNDEIELVQKLNIQRQVTPNLLERAEKMGARAFDIAKKLATDRGSTIRCKVNSLGVLTHVAARRVPERLVEALDTALVLCSDADVSVRSTAAHKAVCLHGMLQLTSRWQLEGKPILERLVAQLQRAAQSGLTPDIAIFIEEFLSRCHGNIEQSEAKRSEER